MDASLEARKRLTATALRRLPSLYLAATPLGGATAALVELDRSATWVRLPAGQTLFNQGDAPDALYVVTHGSLDVEVTEHGSSRAIAVLSRGAFLGEAGVLLGEPRSATVRARRDAELIRIPNDAFQRAVRAEPNVAVELARQLAQREIHSGHQTPPTRRVRTVAVLALDDSTDVKDFTRKLALELGALLLTESLLTELGAN